MTYLSDAHHFRKLVAGVCMLLAPVLLLLGAIVHPEMETSEAAQIAVIADSPDGWYIAHLVLLCSIVLAVPAVLGLMHMLREREVAFGHLGGALALLGLLASTGIVAMEFVAWQAAEGGRAEMTALFERLNETAGVLIPFYLFSFGFAAGMVLLAIGLYLARAVQWWMALFIVIAAVCLAIGVPAALNWLTIVGAAFLVVGLGSIGRMVLTESDEAWEHTPEYKGFRPMLGMR
jgi:hypothetical protein